MRVISFVLGVCEVCSMVIILDFVFVLDMG